MRGCDRIHAAKAHNQIGRLHEARIVQTLLFLPPRTRIISRKKFCFFCPPPQSDSDLRLARSYFHKTRFKNDRPIYNDDNAMARLNI